MNDNQIFGLPQPTGPQQPATKKYVDDNALLLSGGNMTGNIVMQGNRIYSLRIPTGSQQPATKEYTEKYFLQKIGNKPRIIMLIVKSLSISQILLMIMMLPIKDMFSVK